MSSNRRLIRIIALWSCLLLSAYAYIGSHTSLVIPSAKMDPMGQIEIGGILLYQKVNGSYELEGAGLVRHVIADSFQYSIGIEEDLDYTLNLESNLFTIHDPYNYINHRIGLGARNLGWKKDGPIPASSVWGGYGVYTLDYSPTGQDEGRSYYHIGLGQDQSREKKLYPFAGASYQFSFGLTYFEWDGQSVRVGIKAIELENHNMYVSASPRPLSTTGRFDDVVTYGFSFHDNLYKHLEKYLVLKKDYDTEINKLKTRMMTIEARDKALLGISSLPFLEDLEHIFLAKKLKKHEMEDQTKSLVENTAYHMQKGLEYYYQKKYKAAIQQYKIVTGLLPNFPEAYVRLGSIYYQMNKKTDAIQNWQKALQLNPQNDQLVLFLKKTLDKKEFKELINPLINKPKIKTKKTTSPLDKTKTIKKKEPK